MVPSRNTAKVGVVIDGNRRFITELLQDFRNRYQVELFDFAVLRLPVLQSRINDWRYRRSMRQFLARNDVVFFEWAAAHLVAATNFVNLTPLIVRLHSWELFEYAGRVNWDRVARIILVSRAMQIEFTSRFPALSARTEVIYPGKALPSYPPRSRRFGGKIGMLCDLVPVKRVYDVILTLGDLRRAGYDLTLHVGGRPGEGAENRRYLASIERLIAKMNLTDRVIFHGWVQNPAAWLRDIDIFVSNSYWEGLQNALVEAMVAGCYCLAHAWNGAEEVLPASHLYLTSADLYRKIAAYCEMPESDRCAHEAEFREIVENKFAIGTMLSRTREIIETAGKPTRIVPAEQSTPLHVTLE